MRLLSRTIIIAISLLLTFFVASVFASSALPGEASRLQDVSINITTPVGGTDVYEVSRSIGLQILRGAKLVVSGFALIWIVLIGGYMVIFSENEERIKSQKKQLTYMLIAFLFLNIPSTVYTVFYGDTLGKSTRTDTIGDITTINFWDVNTFLGASGFLFQMIGFFEVFIFGAAVLTFTYGFFRIMISGGDEEVRKKAKNQIVYGLMALLFLTFVRYWGTVIAKGDFFQEYATIGNKILGLALYFAPPIAIGFLVYAGFMMISAGGDEERVKKAKSIFMNTFIAALILLGAYSFVSDLATFTL